MDQDIIARAIDIIAAGPVRQPWQHGPFCPWCALADAKGAIEEERSLAWDALDGSLTVASWALGAADERPMSQDEALARLREARG